MPEPLAPDPEQAWKALGLVNDWIRHADAKVGVALAATGVTAVCLYNVAKSVQCASALFVGSAVVCGSLLVAAGVSASIALAPVVKVDGGNSKPDALTNLLFFRHIAKGYRDNRPGYVDALARLTMDAQAMTQQVSEQVYANARVAERKYVWTSRAVRALAGAVICLGLCAVLAL